MDPEAWLEAQSDINTDLDFDLDLDDGLEDGGGDEGGFADGDSEGPEWVEGSFSSAASSRAGVWSGVVGFSDLGAPCILVGPVCAY